MSGTAEGTLKTAAARVGLCVSEYIAHVEAGQKWCTACKAWHPVTDFPADRTRGDGRRARCLKADRGKSSVVDPQKQRARNAVKHEIVMGRLRPAKEFSCTDCGHEWSAGERRHEYDHHLGYDDAHLLDVQPVCTTCHAKREMARREKVA